MDDRVRIDAATHKNLCPHPHVQCVGKINCRFLRLVQAIIEGVSGDANDLQPPVAARRNQRLRRIAFDRRYLDRVADDIAGGVIML